MSLYLGIGPLEAFVKHIYFIVYFFIYLLHSVLVACGICLFSTFPTSLFWLFRSSRRSICLYVHY